MRAADTAQASLIFLHQAVTRFLIGHCHLGMGVKVGEPVALDFKESHFLHVA